MCDKSEALRGQYTYSEAWVQNRDAEEDEAIEAEQELEDAIAYSKRMLRLYAKIFGDIEDDINNMVGRRIKHHQDVVGTFSP